jgi:hypothetical protein
MSAAAGKLSRRWTSALLTVLSAPLPLLPPALLLPSLLPARSAMKLNQ